MIAQAQSGTGKTATFSISILQSLDTQVRETQALVLSPTRELAQQIQKVCPFIFFPYFDFYLIFMNSTAGYPCSWRLHERAMSRLYRRNECG